MLRWSGRNSVVGMTTTEPAGLADYKQFARGTWASGNFAEIARRGLWGVGLHIVQRVGVGAHERVLDVACGTGNAAIRAAQAGGRVVGLDLTPELFDTARVLAAEAGVDVDWVEGDAESLPFDDESFDVVLSTFGTMFAPRHEVAARELARVLKPGGRLGLCNWTPEGGQGTFFRAMADYTPPLPPFASAPIAWGTEEHVRELFAGSGIQLEFERAIAAEIEPFADGRSAVDFLVTNFGPLIKLHGMLEAQGRWEPVSSTLAEIYDRHEPGEYLVVLGRKG
jgi:ubiquinone/menaquinone biosynthesis C-methylase UbiE